METINYTKKAFSPQKVWGIEISRLLRVNHRNINQFQTREISARKLKTQVSLIFESETEYCTN